MSFKQPLSRLVNAAVLVLLFLVEIKSFSSICSGAGRLLSRQRLTVSVLSSVTGESEVSVPIVPKFKKLPVTVLSGFLGAGKTTLLQHILKSDHNGKRYAVIVNDMSELNIDGSLVQPHVQHQEEKLIEMSNGCICCTLREDLLKEVASLARQDRFDHLIIESTGISEPLPVAETFTFETEDGQGESLLDIANIDSMVTVVDAVNFMKDMQDAEDLMTRGLQAGEDDTRTLTDLLVSQVEFASVIVINKCDLVSPEHLAKVHKLIRALNAEAKVLEATRSKIDIAEIIGSNTYDFDKVSQSAAWVKAINGDTEHISELDEFGISSFVYRARRPFHPERLMNFITEKLGTDDDEDDEEEGEEEDVVGVVQNKIAVVKENKVENKVETIVGGVEAERPHVIRSKGFFWLASRPYSMMLWSQAGGLFQLSPGGSWWIDTPKDLWPEDKEGMESVMSDWQGEDGDRRWGITATMNFLLPELMQELVFIGTNLIQAAMVQDLDDCLLTEEEMKLEPIGWESFEDPFPASPQHEEGEEDEENSVTMVLGSAEKAMSGK